MSVIAVCSLSLVPASVARLRPWGLVTLLNPESMIETPRGVAPERHLKVGINDINEGLEGLTTPEQRHVSSIIDHGLAWDNRAPLLIHCWAGVSRSTASAFIIACARHPHVAPTRIATSLRALSPTATPNRLLIALADDMLSRGGDMVGAIDAIGRGEDCWEGTPFELPDQWDQPS